MQMYNNNMRDSYSCLQPDDSGIHDLWKKEQEELQRKQEQHKDNRVYIEIDSPEVPDMDPIQQQDDRYTPKRGVTIIEL